MSLVTTQISSLTFKVKSHSKESVERKILHYSSKDSKNFANAYLDNLGSNDSNDVNNKLLHVSALPEDIEIGSNASPFNNAINKYINSKGSKFTH